MRLEKSSEKSAPNESQAAVEQAEAPSQALQLKAQAGAMDYSAGAALLSPSPAPVQMEAVADASAAREAFAMPTWDSKAADGDSKGAWVDAAPAAGDAAGQHADKKGKMGDHRQVRGVASNAADVHRALEAGELSEAEVQGLDVKHAAQINPLGDAPRKILKNTYGQSWNRAKHATVGKGAGAEMVMTKLWEFRQWHHDKILKATQAELEPGELSKWAAAGSTTLTSDIDVNLKGSNTEKAVKVFNRLFKEDDWAYEAGVVYDVNVYALDFLHGKTFAGVKRDGQRVAAKEGDRAGEDAGGVSLSSPADAAADANHQEVWTLVKMRLYMTPDEWDEYKGGVDSTGAEGAKWAEVESRYANYRDTLRAEMTNVSKATLAAADESEKTGITVLNQVAQQKAEADGSVTDKETQSEDNLMAASNRVYERKLKEMKKTRNRVKEDIDEYDALIEQGKRTSNRFSPLAEEEAEMLHAEINENLAILRDLISECALYSNEAYLTDGAVNHAVVGLQEGIEIHQTKAESLHAVNENVADCLKEMARHGENVGEAGYKAGKYMWRLADAARNMGMSGGLIDTYYDAGFELANTIKGGGKSPQGHGGPQGAYDVIHSKMGISPNDPAGVADLKGMTRSVGVSASVWYKSNVGSSHQHDLGETVTKDKH